MTALKKLRQRKCRSCKASFTPWSTTTAACSPKCAITLVREAQEVKERKRIAERKQAIKSLGQLHKEGQPCISCQRHHTGQIHAGHYRSVGAAPELRYNEDNVHAQCAPCNNQLSGNAIDYRINLINKIGVERVEQLEGPHESKKYTREDIQEVKVKYRLMARRLEAQLNGE